LNIKKIVSELKEKADAKKSEENKAAEEDAKEEEISD